MANKKNQTKRKPHKLKIKKGDSVLVIAGEYKGVEGEVLEVIPHKNRAVVDGVNIRRKAVRPTDDNPGGIQEMAAPIHISNLMLLDPKTGDPTRVGRKLGDDGKLVRYSKTSGEIIK